MSSAREAGRWPGLPDCGRSAPRAGRAPGGAGRYAERPVAPLFRRQRQHQVLAARSDQPVERRAVDGSPGATRRRRQDMRRRESGAAPEQQLPRDADHGRRRPLRVERPRPRRSDQPADRRDHLDRRSRATIRSAGRRSARGVAYWADNGRDDRIFTYRNNILYALDPKTGESIPSFGTGGRIDLALGLSPLARRLDAGTRRRSSSATSSCWAPRWSTRTPRRRWRARLASCARSTRGAASCGGHGARYPRPASLASKRGKTNRGRTPAPATSGRS